MTFSENDNKEVMSIFQTESEEIIERIFSNLFELETNPSNREIIASTYRDLHSLKGAVRMVGFNNIQNIIHKMEDIFDAINNLEYSLELNILKLMSKTLEVVSRYLQESIINSREIIDEEYSTVISNLEYIIDVVIPEHKNNKSQSIISAEKNDSGIDKALVDNQETINFSFNKSFELIDGIIPEEETQDIVILKEEIQKIYDIVKDSNLYEVKTSLENIITKLDFVMNATNTLTISEILELRNELSSAAAKFTTSCIETEDSGFTFFDVAEKITMLQGSSVYTNEIKEDIIKLKENVEDQSILEVVNTVLEILDFILENSVQLEEQMMLTLKSAIEYCAAPSESIDSDLIVQQLEIMKQLLELNYKKDSDVSEVKNLSTQTVTGPKNSSSSSTNNANGFNINNNTAIFINFLFSCL